MSYILALIFLLALYFWDKRRKKPPHRPGEPETPDVIGDADRGHRE